jgi:ABC-type nitrate/sulfonate/bicarbonate transport system permease component
VLAGFAIAVALGIPIGLGMAYSPVFRALFNPIFCLLKPMPPLAWISVAILWMGIGEAPKIFIIVLGSLIPVILNSYNGLLLIDEEMYDVVRMLGGSRWDRIRLVSAPAALPSIGAGLQIAISVAWGSVVAAEMVSSRSGLGFIIMQGMKISDPGMIISGMVVIALLAFFSSLLVEALLRRVCVWRQDIRGL